MICWKADRPRLRHGEIRRVVRHPECHLHHRRARRERARDRDAGPRYTVAVFDEPSRAVAPLAPRRQIDDERAADIDARPRAVDDLEDVVDIERVVVELHQDARIAAEDHDAFGRRLG